MKVIALTLWLSLTAIAQNLYDDAVRNPKLQSLRPTLIKRVLKAPETYYILANTLDVTSSAGMTELNPVLGRGPFGGCQVAIKVGGAMVVLGVSRLLPRRARRVFLWSATGVTGGITASNLLRR